ncbi:MAG: prepilin peptidase [Salinigranum sp.]
MFASTPDLLRLLAVPALGWAAWRDVRTRRVPNAVWYPLAALGVVLLVWEALGHVPPTALADRWYLVRVAVSLGFVVPLSYAFWRIGGFGGADAKAFMALAVLFPTFPAYYLPSRALPLVETTIGVFSMTLLTNTVIVGLAYPLALAARNALVGDFSPVMFLGRRVTVDSLSTAHGRLFETREGFTRRGLDLDALRMYLRWRGLDLDALCESPESFRDPGSIRETHDPTDGAVAGGPLTDGGRSAGVGVGADVEESAAVGADVEATAEVGADVEATAEVGADVEGSPDSGADVGRSPDPGADVEDPWGAAAFLDDIDGTAYGTTPETLREGLALVVEREEVWISPGIPFIVPMFVGLLLALTYGDLLFGALHALGLA